MVDSTARPAKADLDLARVDRIVATYLVVAGLWILAGGPLAAWLAGEAGLPVIAIEVAKGLAFVLLTALLLRVALRRWAGRIRDAALAERAAADRLRRLDELRSEFLTSVSHELRTPLTSIIGYADSVGALARARDEQEIADHADRLVANAERLRGLVLDLLDTDTLLRGAGQLRPRRAEIGALVERVAATVEAAEHEVRTGGQPLEATVDVPKVERVVAQLLHNALRHTPPGSVVDVRWHADDGELCLAVQDDGPGFPVLEDGTVFAPFVQGPAAAAQPNPGMGLGLTLVQQYVQLHGGRVGAHNSPGGGACVEVWLPLVAGTPTPAA